MTNNAKHQLHFCLISSLTSYNTKYLPMYTKRQPELSQENVKRQVEASSCVARIIFFGFANSKVRRQELPNLCRVLGGLNFGELLEDKILNTKKWQPQQFCHLHIIMCFIFASNKYILVEILFRVVLFAKKFYVFVLLIFICISQQKSCY